MKRSRVLPVGSWRQSLSLGTLFLLAVTFAATATVKAQSFSEGFDTVASNTAAPLPNWVAVNRSSPVGGTGWFQGTTPVATPDPGPFYAQAPANTDSYIGANYNSTSGAGTISNWLLSPVHTFRNGDTVSFYTRTVDNPQFADRLEFRLSLNGASTNVGSLPTDVGDFTTLLITVNPTLVPTGYPSTWTKFTATISGLSGPTSGRLGFRYFVTDGGPAGTNSDYIGIDTFAYTSTAVAKSPVDYDGDGKTDWSVVRNTGGGQNGQVTWFNCINGLPDATCFSSTQWGLASDFYVPADYDGDGKTDIAVWRPASAGSAAFYILQSATNTVRGDNFGQTGDNPTVVGDYTGDGKADPAVYRAGASVGAQSFFYYRVSNDPVTGGIAAEQWGQNGDFVAPGDYDGDGKYDFMVQRNGGNGQGVFFLRTNTTNNMSAYGFGLPTDVVVPGDYDGDGKTDIATIRGINGQINWFYRSSITGNTIFLGPFGLSASDVVVQGDYDGDGRTDQAVWRPGSSPSQSFYYVMGTTSGFIQKGWGVTGDYPVANFNVH